jgi:hypothetical protein
MIFLVAWVMSLVQPGRFYTPQQLPALFACVAATTAGRLRDDDHSAPGRWRRAARPCAGLPGTGTEAIPAAFPFALLS